MKRVIALTDAGRRLGERLCAALDDAELWFRPEPFGEHLRKAFNNGDALLMICATGIAVRTLAPTLGSKHEDPPVIVLDEAGRFVIPLLSGHQGGANDLAAKIAELLGAQLVLTTANPYLRPVHAAGFGCERNCDLQEIEALLFECLQQAELDAVQLDSLASIDIKADEAGLLALAEKSGLPFLTYPPARLNEMDDLLSIRSDYVFETVGVYGVAESAALTAAADAAGAAPELVVTKQKSTRATCAIARAYPPILEEAE